MKALDKEILRISLPSILANITIPLVGMVDLGIAGHLNSTISTATLIGGIAIGTMLFDLLYWNFEFLRVGTGGMTAQAYGAGQDKECGRVLAGGLAIALGFSILILALQVPFLKLIFLFVKCSDEVKELATQYFLIRVWAAPATLSLFALKGWFIGMQDGVSSMATDLIINFVNIIVSIALAFGVQSLGIRAMGYNGIAAGTVVAQFSGLLFALAVIAIKYRRVFAGGLSFKGFDYGRMISVNFNIFIRALALLGVYVGFTAISARFGDLLLATGSIMMKLLMLFSYFTDGFAFAGEALTGKYIGARDKEMTREAIHRVFAWSIGVGLFFILIYFVLGMPLLRLMTDDEAVIESCRQFFVWLAPMPIIGVLAFTWDGIYAGATAAADMRNSSLIALVAFFVVWIILFHFHGTYDATAMHILLCAYFAHLAGRSIYLQVRHKKAILESDKFHEIS